MRNNIKRAIGGWLIIVCALGAVYNYSYFAPEISRHELALAGDRYFYPPDEQDWQQYLAGKAVYAATIDSMKSANKGLFIKAADYRIDKDNRSKDIAPSAEDIRLVEKYKDTPGFNFDRANRLALFRLEQPDEFPAFLQIIEAINSLQPVEPGGSNPSEAELRNGLAVYETARNKYFGGILLFGIGGLLLLRRYTISSDGM